MAAAPNSVVRRQTAAQDGRMRLIFALTLLACAACSPEAPPPAEPAAEVAAAPGAAVTFMAPSGNIGCIYIPSGGTDVYQPAEPGAELQCDRAEPEYARVVLPENSAARIVATDERGCCSGETIAYGDRWAEGAYTCDVTDVGVSCASAAGHGFTLSRARADVH
jgi:hypothetical protein